MKNIWSALAEPNRLAIVELLRNGPLSVGEITDQLEIKQPQVSKHLRILSEAGIVTVQPQANKRIYHLNPQPFQELDHWLTSFHHLWNERFDRLDDLLIELLKKNSKKTDQN